MRDLAPTGRMLGLWVESTCLKQGNLWPSRLQSGLSRFKIVFSLARFFTDTFYATSDKISLQLVEILPPFTEMPSSGEGFHITVT